MFKLKSRTLGLLSAGVLLTACSFGDNQKSTASKDKSISITQVRNATLQITYAGKRLLIDPMLAKKGAYPGFEGTANSHLRNPLVDLPFEVEKVIDVDAVLLTHVHPDHWDTEAQKLIPKNKPIFVQNKEDEKVLKEQGFISVETLTTKTKWEGITLTRTDGQHGSDNAVKNVPLLGIVSGVILSHPSQKSIYIAGDTIWNEEVKATLNEHKPDIVILNAGAATVIGFGPIIMDENDVVSVVKYAPYAKVIATHMEAINHCVLTRKKLKEFLEAENLSSHVEIPADGETLNL